MIVLASVKGGVKNIEIKTNDPIANRMTSTGIEDDRDGEKQRQSLPRKIKW